MYNLIVYGSLLNPKELSKHGIDLDGIECVKVKGFKRIFNQLPSWREVEGIKKAVLNIKYDKNSWFNAIVVKNLPKEYFANLDKREKGYDKIRLQDGIVKDYKGNIIKNCVVYKGKNGRQSSEILPNTNYFEICLEGAGSYFDEFLNDFLKTTYQNDLHGKVKLIKIT